ncbi:f-box protein skip22 [Anaeramoeba ignava]|uniref:F-box protein skip22 n=1 Tax=Anaeramoeba ignava TaxID=1746090 RepID=A0A9Q0LLP4_ANAIG|nr:f-box protein skip22 [Anaeramoeba ignava]
MIHLQAIESLWKEKFEKKFQDKESQNEMKMKMKMKSFSKQKQEKEKKKDMNYKILPSSILSQKSFKLMNLLNQKSWKK